MIVLASASPRRKELLSFITTDFKIVPADIDETVENNVPLEKRPEYLAVKKALHISKNGYEKDIVIGCDTGVFIDGKMLGKPKNREDAENMLKLLSGRQHKVITGCCTVKNGVAKSFSNVTLVEFFELSDSEIEEYIATGEPFDKAGAYGIQGKGSLLVKKIDGDYFNVVGLPVSELNRILSQCIKELSLDDRPREKLMQQGAAGLSNSELLAILIRTGTQKRSALRIAEELTASSGLYQNIACVHSVAELAKVKGLGPAKAATILAALELGKRIAAAGSQVKLKIESPQKGAEILLPRLRYEQHEKFLVLLLDSKNQVIRMEQVSEGSVNSSVVHPREVFAPALLYHAAAILVAHNHPSGDPKPSQEDKELTRSLNETGIIMGIPLIDHLVIGDGIFFSFREQGYLDK